VEILDVYENTALRIYPSRLAGVDLTDSDKVKYYRLNAAGEISHLILNNVTGDLYQYGVVTSATSQDLGEMNLLGSYVYDIGGQSIPTGPLSKTFDVQVGPARFIMKDGALDSMTNLTPVKLSNLDGSEALGENTSWPLWDGMAVYELRDGKYYLSSRSIVEGGDHTLTGYYDKAPDQGGVIRVLVAKAS